MLTQFTQLFGRQVTGIMSIDTCNGAVSDTCCADITS